MELIKQNNKLKITLTFNSTVLQKISMIFQRNYVSNHVAINLSNIIVSGNNFFTYLFQLNGFLHLQNEVPSYLKPHVFPINIQFKPKNLVII